MPNDFYQVSLKLIIKNKEGETLILKAAHKGSYVGFYDLPGGRIKINEFQTAFEKLLSREVREELGEKVKINVSFKPVAIGRHLIPAALIKKPDDIHVLYIFFEAKYLGGKILLSKEHVSKSWVDIHKVKLDKYFKSGILEGIKMYLNNNG